MNDKKIDVNEIVKVEQLPVIFYKLEEVGKYIDTQIALVKDMECTEENKVEVKQIRANVNNTLKEFEDKRKQIKQEVLKDYNQFEDKYELEVKSKLENASQTLKDKIDVIEDTQKKEKEDNLRLFFNEYQQKYHLEDIITFEDMNLNITLSASEKSLKDYIIAFCDKINNDISLIKQEEYSSEILLEYKKNNFDFTKSKLEVLTRHKQLEELSKKQENVEIILDQEKKVENNVEEIIAPVKEVEEEKIEVQFTVKGTRDNIKKLKDYIIELGLEWK